MAQQQPPHLLQAQFIPLPHRRSCKKWCGQQRRERMVAMFEGWFPCHGGNFPFQRGQLRLDGGFAAPGEASHVVFRCKMNSLLSTPPLQVACRPRAREALGCNFRGPLSKITILTYPRFTRNIGRCYRRQSTQGHPTRTCSSRTRTSTVRWRPSAYSCTRHAP